MSDSGDHEPTSITSTIDDAIKLVDRKPEHFQDWRVKELGLQLVLFGLAEVQARRVSNLSSMVYNLEGKVFEDDNIRNLEPSKLLQVYKMGVEALKESSDYVRSTLKSIDWTTVEAQLIAVAASESAGATKGNDNENITKIVSDLLSRLTVNTMGVPVVSPKAVEDKTSETVN